MPTITLDVPDDLSEQVERIGKRWEEWLRLSLQQPALPARLYREILMFLANSPSADQILNYKPDPEMSDRLKRLLSREAEGSISLAEREELDEFERIEHLMVMLKTGAF